MDLKEFVSEALTQIVEGVMEAQEKIKDTGAVIVPNMSGKSGGNFIRIDNDTMILQNVEMNVALSVIEREGKQGGIGIAKVIHAGINSESGSQNETTNSIRFEVPMALPVMKGKKHSATLI